MSLRIVLQKLFRRRIVLAAALALALVIAVSLLAGPLSGLDPNETAVAQRLNGPSAAHLLGTDELGRDLFARIAYGGRYSLTIALLTAVGAVGAGTLLGLVAGFFRPLDAPVMRVVDAMMSFPDILLAIALVGILGPSMLNVVLALTLVYTPRVARVVRASTLVVRELLFVEAARAVGVSTLRILWRHVLPEPAVADPGAGVVHLRVRDPGRGGAVVPGRGRAARDPDLGHDGRGQPAVRPPGAVDRAVPGPGHHRHRAVAAAAGRRHPRPARSAPAQVDVNRLEVRHLCTSFVTDEGRVDAVADVSFAIRAGGTTAIVGESGSGKSVTSLTLMRLLPRATRTQVSGQALFVTRSGQAVDLLTLPEPQMRALRGNEVAMIFQEPMTS
jgi:ABC-type phosphate/phosphonate transport system permease subunit